MNQKVVIERVKLDDPRLVELIKLLDRELAERDGDEHSFYAAFNVLPEDARALIATVDGEPVGCGAFRGIGEKEAEVKRMFVLPSVRGKRIGVEILKTLEAWAKESGFSACVLETGKKQPEAIRLYERHGYERIPNYGQYAEVENSVCMKKDI